MFWAIITAILGAYAGAEGTSLAWRRFGIPVVLATRHLLNHLPPAGLITYALWVGILSVGYGIPDEHDEGSFLGKLLKRDWLVRGFIAISLSIASVLQVFTGGATTLRWLLCSCVLVAIWAVFGGDSVVNGEGKVRLLGKDLLVEDLILYGALGGYVHCVTGGEFLM